MRSSCTRAVALGLCIVMAGCQGRSEPSPQDLMAQAEFLVREARWADAIPVLKEYLCANPEDSGAHFYLGRCWLNVAEFNNRQGPWLVLAEGELRLAVQLFEQHGRVSTIERFSNEYFETICHLERAKVYLRQLAFLAGNRGRLAGATAHSVIADLRQAVADAKAIDADSPDVWAFEKLLSSLEEPPVQRPAEPGKEL